MSARPNRARRAALLGAVGLALAVAAGARAADVLTTLDYRVVGVALRPARESLAIPKNVPGALTVELIAGGEGNTAEDLARGAIVEATLRGPAFAARRVIGLPNGDLALPPLPLVGDYSLDDIRLVDVATGATKLDASPRSVPITVFDEVLVSRVTSRPLGIEEIEARGIVVDETSFRVLEFEVGFVLDGQTVPVKFPVVAPRFDDHVELIPKAELEELLAEAEVANAALALGTELPAALEAAGLDVDVRGVNFQFVEPAGEEGLALAVPPIPGLLVVPGRIGMLNQFFSVMLFTENAAPAGSGLSVRDLAATMTLPPGLDRVAGTHAAPGDDPLRFARIGPDAVIEPVQPLVAPGTDGQLGTADDRSRLQPGETGQAEFLVEGLREGLHLMDVVIDGTLDGLGASPRRIRGFASGSVLVRNPKFSLAFTHPRTIRAGEPYTASVTILNTANSVANLVSVTLPAASLSGAVFEPGTPEVAELGTIGPGESRTAEFRLRAQRTGAITFSQLTSDADIVGRFRLRMGVDERGVPLSPDAIGYPDFASDLFALAPPLAAAIERYLGQALSVATAAQLPPGIEGVSRAAVNARVVEIAEAGQRLRYGDAAGRVLADLLLDFQGGRSTSRGLDQIWRETGAGRELREALLAALAAEAAESDAVELLAARAADLAGRGEGWLLAAVDDEAWSPSFELLGAFAELGASAIGSAAGFSGAASGAVDGHWVASRPIAGTLRLVAEADTGAAELALLALAGDGSGTLLRWSLPALPEGACLRADVAAPAPVLAVDQTCDGTPESSLAPASEPVVEPPPAVLAAVQDEKVLAGRPFKHCPRPDIENYGTVVAVLFSKPMTQESVDRPEAYRFEDGNTARSVRIQPGGRVALLNLAQPVGALVARTLSVAPEVADPRGHPLVANAIPLQATAAIGIALSGLVVRGSGEPAVDVPVTLTIHDEQEGFTCEPFPVRPAQARTDGEGRFHFDYVPAGIPYSVSATDTTGLGSEAEALILEASSEAMVDRAKLLELAGGSAQGTLLESFSVGALPEAIAVAEGIDRALLRDAVDLGSPRVGTEVPVALRFRGRGTVTGTVFESDGITPAPRAAVNLFPDPDSRELGRGLFTDADGRFAFFGVPLGAFTVEATSPAGRTRTVAGVLGAPGEVRDVAVVLSAEAVPRGAIEGRVLEPGTGAGHAGARVFVGQQTEEGFENVVALAVADPDGSYRAENVPVGTWDLVAVSFDGKRKGERRDVGAIASGVGFADVTLQGRASVGGRVEFANGEPGAFALVGGGEAVVRADADGRFTLTGVPTGRRSIEAAVEADPARGIEFTRLGRASLDVIAGVENQVVVRLVPAGRILGIVRDAAGSPVPNVDVSIPQQGGFLWVHANAEGRFEFPNLPLDDYTVSAPAPPHEDTDVTGILETLSNSPTQDEIQAAITQVFEIFLGVNNPLLNGEGGIFNPSHWGYEKVSLAFDGQTVLADVRYLPEGTIAGVVRNGQGVPIGARVRLTGVGPTNTGDVGFVVRGERDSDPALGTFTFAGQALAGEYGVQAATPFYPRAISVSGQTTRIDPDRTDLVLQFPATEETNGRLAGRVFAPDGSPVVDARVRIGFGDLEVRTDATGRFDTQIDLPAFDEEGHARSYAVEATDDATGLRGQSFVTLAPGVTNQVDVRLLARNGSLRVRVLDATGAPVAGAAVEVRQGSFPRDELQGTTGPGGELLLANLFEGSYDASASAVEGATTRRGRTAVSVAPGQEALAVVRLGATATLQGRFVALDRTTPIAFAQLRIDGIGFATSDALGAFEFTGVPLGTHRLFGQDSLTGRVATLSVSLAAAGEVREVLLVEREQGLVEGAVIDGYGSATVAGAQVTLRVADGVTAPRTVTTDPGGRFSFPGVPAGALELEARLEAPGVEERGTARATLAAGVARLELDVALSPLTTASFLVLEPDGLVPADATVTLAGPGGFLRSADTDVAGRASFEGVPLGAFTVTARSRTAGQTRSSVTQALAIGVRPAQPEVTLVLGGVGRVEGRLFASDGTTPIAGRAVDLAMLDTKEPPLQALTAPDGSFAFDDVALGDFRLVGRDGALAATGNGTLGVPGDVAQVDLVLGPSGSIVGRLVSQDGTLPIGFAELALAYDAPSGALGRDGFRTAADGLFHFEAIPVGAFALETYVLARNGVARVAGAVATDGETVDLGDVRLDEEDPHVVASAPADGDQEAAVDTVVRLTLNEPLDPASVDPSGIFLRPLGGALLPATVELAVDPGAGDLRALEIRPDAPLASETDHEVVVVDGELLDAVGTVIARGPRDLVGRTLAAPFRTTFRTRDQDPPGLLSITPADGAVQVDPRAVVRLSFDEPLATSGIAITVTGPGGAVPGRVDVGVGARVVVFTPDVPLAPNASYTAQIDGVRDVAGNLAEGLPLSASFATLDTLGPAISSLALSGPAVGGATRNLVATLAEAEADVSIRVSLDLVTVGQSAPGVLAVPVALPLAGSVLLRAVAIDRFGNEGPIAELPVTIAANAPPAVTLERLVPASGPAPSGSTLSVRVRGSDDVGVVVLKAAAEGAGTAPLVQSTGAPILLEIPVSPEAGPGASVLVHAEALDGNGQSSGEQVFAVPVSDGTAPSVAFTAPAEGTALVPGTVLTVALEGSDGFGVTRFELAAEGALPASQSQDAAGAPGTATASFSLDLPAELASGESVTLRARAFDAAGLSSEAVLVLTAPDTRAPRLAELVPAAGAAVGVAPRIAARFDEPIARASATAASFQLRDAADAIVPAAFGFEDGDRVVILTPAAPLAVGQGYRAVLAAGLTDLAGNPAADADGNPITGVVHAFTVGGAVLTAPTAGQRVIEGQRFEAALAADVSLGAQTARFLLNDAFAASAALDAAGVARATLTAPTLAVAGGPALRVAAWLVLPGGAELAAGEVVLELLAAAGDFDGDGLTNGQEIAAGLDPFTDDVALDNDGDGLTNGDEVARGTDPNDADSDGDGLADGAEIAAGLDPLDADSDDDGLPDGEDVLGGPRVLSLEPASGATNVSVRPRVRVRFDEPVLPASVTAASFQLLLGGVTPVAADFVLSEGDRVVDLVPTAPLAFSASYTLRLTSAMAGTDALPIRNTDGSAVTAPIERSFTTGAFGITEPAGGSTARENTTLALAASGDAALGVASVRFEVNGAEVATDGEAPFTASYAVPPAAGTPALSITAIAFDAASAELARDTISVTVLVGLDAASHVLGVPLGGSADLVLRLPVPRAEPLEVAVASLDPAVAGVAAAPFTIPPGATELRVPVAGLAEGSTTLVATTLEDVIAIAVSVSALPSGTALEALAAPVGAVVQAFPSLGQVAVAPSETSTVTLRLFDAPVAATTLLSIRTSDAAVADVLTPVAVAAGSTDATLPITAGPGGEAVLQLVGAGTGRELRVGIGTPGVASTPPVVAPPVGIAVLAFPSAGDVILPESSTRTVTLRILDEPAAADTQLVIASSDPSVASIAGPVVIPAGSTYATLEITTGAAGSAVVTLVGGGTGRELHVISGTPSLADTPPVVAPPVGIAVLEAGTAGTLFIDPGDTKTFDLALLGYPSVAALPVSAASQDPGVATVAPAAQVIPTGESRITLTVTATASGDAETRIDLAFGVERRTLRVLVGIPDPADAPVTVAPPVGIEVQTPP